MAKYKAITRTYDAYPNATPVERLRMQLEDNNTYSKEWLDMVFSGIKSPSDWFGMRQGKEIIKNISN